MLPYHNDRIIMRLLLVSYVFPPYNSIGAVRVGKIADHLLRLGWDVRVITAKNQPFSETLPLNIDADRVRYTRSLELDWPARLARRRGGNYVNDGVEITNNRLKNALKKIYTNLLFVPDAHVGWLPFARAEGKRLAREWKPDLVYASGPPFTSLMAPPKRFFGPPTLRGATR
jgi:hypothetical protein